MHPQLRKFRLALFALSAVLCAACTIAQIQGPKYVPPSSVLVGPEPKIPNVFIGCWKGTVDRFDTIQSFSPQVSESSIKALSTTYEFCFTKRPDGTGQLDLTDLEIDGNKARVSHFDNRATSIDAESYRGSMRNHATVEMDLYAMWIFPIHMTEEIYAEEDFKAIPPDVVLVKGKQLVVIGGNMLASMTFHSEFHRVSPSDQNPIAAR